VWGLKSELDSSQAGPARLLIFKRRCDAKRSRWNDIRNTPAAATAAGTRSYAEAGAAAHATAAPETGSNTWSSLVKNVSQDWLSRV
jgi:hypothetical protein